jgi:hypothetical protein
MDGQIDKWTDRQMDRCNDTQMDGRKTEGWIDVSNMYRAYLSGVPKCSTLRFF